jgi:glycogen debranching enzyme
MQMIKTSAAALAILLACIASGGEVDDEDDARLGSVGVYFSVPAAQPREVPVFAEVKAQLPTIVFDDRRDLVRLYDRAWELAFANIEQPVIDEKRGHVLARTYVDAAFSDNIFQWDTCFMMGFAKYGHEAFAFIESLDNFYALQRDDGFICREFRKADAAPVMFPTERDSVNPPIFAWAEVEYARSSGDVARFAVVLPVLDKYASWLEANRSAEVKVGEGASARTVKLYWNTPFGSGMDNTPERGDAWVSMSAQMAEMYESLAVMATHAKLPERAAAYSERRAVIADAINAAMWDDEAGMYFNVMSDGSRVRERTIGCFWPIWADVASEERAKRVSRVLLDESEFYTQVPFATISKTHEKFDEWGGYWLGASWAPTTRMALDGLKRSGAKLAAYRAAYQYVDAINSVHEATGTIWENYAPMYLSFGGNAPSPQPGQPSKRDFVGWSGLGPIAILIEDIIGIEPDALSNSVTWTLQRTDRVGVQGLQLGKTRLSLVAQPREVLSDEVVIDVESGGAFTLRVRVEEREVTAEIQAGRTQVRVP